MRRTVVLAISAMMFSAGPAIADEKASDDAKPIQLTAEQLDSVTAAGYGKTIIDLTGKSFGEFIGPAKKAGTATHSNYAGGAKALVEAVTGPGHPIPGS